MDPNLTKAKTKLCESDLTYELLKNYVIFFLLKIDINMLNSNVNTGKLSSDGIQISRYGIPTKKH